jgi:hypothetical protein
MMQPTVHDHVLECALFQQRTRDDRVAVLTDDTALKIKALAEVIFIFVVLVSLLKDVLKPLYPLANPTLVMLTVTWPNLQPLIAPDILCAIA